MLRRRAGTSNPRRAVLRAAVAGGVPTAREVATDHSGACVADLGFPRGSFRECLNSVGAAPLVRKSFIADGTARPRVHFAPQGSTLIQGQAL